LCFASAFSEPGFAMSRCCHPPELKDVPCHLPVADCRTTYEHCHGKLLVSDQRIVQIALGAHSRINDPNQPKIGDESNVGPFYLSDFMDSYLQLARNECRPT
jgi:hypothetical protein